MTNPFKNSPLNINELIAWKKNPLINPRSGKKIKVTGNIYKLINTAYNNIDKSESIEKTNEFNLLDSNDDRDPVSLNLYWIEENNERKIVYPKENFDQLIFYYDSKNLLRCFEKETLKYLKGYNIKNHPVTLEPLPTYIYENIGDLNLIEIANNKTIENMALDVFQYFSYISIFINHEWFLELDKKLLLKFNYELRDFWLQNFTNEQRNEISTENILTKTDPILINDNLETIQRYLLDQMKIMLECTKEEYKYMINYIILGALGIVIPPIKELYPDFSFAF